VAGPCGGPQGRGLAQGAKRLIKEPRRQAGNSLPGNGSHQRIIWQCYDGDNYYYNFMVSTSPEEFNAVRAELQGIINSVRFGN
jgi:hypothetical protein